ncbi:KICSTOR complex protein SZT2-like isoform X3 [Physella acuta]|uniref:KICSTOR complex protein SZT2-like isoform X3 n=1 Tax=Physella acuta TaxID=109671 RepID=UPI0027DB28DD|nr:KICSTOR complex protein SZT2-like isoform X3 [Physella acuta]
MDSHPPVDAQEGAFQSGTDLPDVHASHVYVLMKKNIRVSRNIRACWFFRHLQRQVYFKPLASLEPQELTEELTLVSVIPKDTEVKLLPGLIYKVHVGPDTIVTFLSSQYKLSFTLDLSPSLMSVDIQNSKYVFDEIFQSLSRCLRGLVMPLVIPGSCLRYSPDLYISVICHTPVVCSFTNQVLVQGVKVNQDNLDYYLKHIEVELNQYETALSNSFVTLLKLYRRKEGFFLDEDEEEGDGQFNITDHIGSPEAGFTNMLRYGILSLQLLPDNSSSGIIIITDGIVGLPTSYLIEMLLNQMRNNTTMCSFIKVGCPSGLYRKLAHVPHIELMQAIATATFGAYLGAGPDVSEEKNEANLYHRALLFWSFQRGLEGFKYELTHYSDEDLPGSISWIKKMLHRHPITGESFGVESLRKEREKRTVRAGLHSVLSVRLREGYTIKSVCFKKDHSEIHVKLHFPWRDYGKIEYAASAAWPLNTSSPITLIEVTVEGSYDLLHEMLCKPNNEVKSNLRINNIKSLWTILERICSTDTMLEHLQSFSSEPVYYKTPESLLSGVPLFYMPQEGPTLNMQLKASTMERFAAFWKAVIQLDTNSWQKWLHSHRIGLVLEHDRQFPKCFQVPNASSRFTTIQCRQALASLSLLLREWSTFVLAENHSYIKFIQQEQDKPPKFFCVLRLTSKAPNMIIRLGFLGGTPASIRLEELDILREKIKNLHFPQRGTQKNIQKMASSSSISGQEEKQRPYKSPLNREGSEIACCVLLKKPVEKILVVYESKPKDMTIVKEAQKEMTSRKQQDPMRSVFRTLTHYLQHQRWVWNIQANSKSSLSMTSVSRMLATLTKLRLQEGFHFAASGAGVSNLVLEVDMKETSDSQEDDNLHTCVIQYIIFPPHVNAIDDSLSEDEQDETESTEADGEVQLVTECWVEPQYGVCCNNTPERQHFNGLTYLNLAKAFYPYDYECVSSLTTFEHLVYLCENSAIPSPDVVASRQSSCCFLNYSPPSTPGNPYSKKREESFRSEPTVNFISFPFDLQSILPRSQQAELLFSTFIIGDASNVSQDVVLDPKEPNELLVTLFYDKLKESHNNEILLSTEDCYRFLEHVLQRPRDHEKNPVPFSYRLDGAHCAEGNFAFEPGNFSETDHEMTDASSTSTRKNLEPGSWKVPPKKEVENPRLMSSEAPSKHGKLSTNVLSPPPVDYGYSQAGSGPGETLKQAECFHCPMWKCYVKKDVTEHLLLTFVPACFDDLLLLNPPPVNAETTKANEPTLAQTNVVDQKVGDGASDSPGPESLAEKSHVSDDGDKSSASPNVETRNEKVQQWVNKNTDAMKATISGPLLMPVYVYSCHLKNITNSLVNRGNFNLPEDIFENLSFHPADDTKCQRSPRGQLLSFDVTSDDQDDRDSWRSSLDRRSTDSNSYRLDSFKEHCKILSELYFNSFLSGVFLSLQQKYFVDKQDVDSAINNICAESHPLETDMTTYLLASCSHVLQLVQKAKFKEKCRANDENRTAPVYHRQLSVRFQDMDLQKEDEGPKIPEVLQLPSLSLELTEEEWASMSQEPCHQMKENHQLTDSIKNHFAKAINTYLCPVPNLPDFYFYCPNVISLKTENSNNEKDEASDGVEDGNMDNVHEEEDIVITRPDELGETSVGTSMESNPDDTSNESFEANVSTESVDQDPIPLFIHFTCTVKQKTNFHHMSLRTVPQCFGQITKGLSDPFLSIDFSDFKVTFDINCLTLLGDIDHVPRRPSYSRLLSNMSQGSQTGRDELEDRTSTVIGTPKPLGDPISHLPRVQHAAIYAVKDEIESIMQEEVISALRHMHPITSDTLIFVADYIRTAVQWKSRTAMYQCVNLQFVYGADQSLNLFIEEFERTHFQGYRLTKEGSYYFLIVNKAMAHQMRYQQFEIAHGPENENMAMCKEERSFSLPCVFPEPGDQLNLPVGTQSLINMEDTETSGDTRHRPRSASDTKSHPRLQSQASGIKVGPSLSESSSPGQLIAASLLTGPLLAIQDLRIKEEDKDSEICLKKSSSFAGLHGSHGRSPANTASSSRSRHCSAPSGPLSVGSRPSTLPQSPSVISSRESTTDDGFDGDVSDMELDETASMSDISSSYPELPDYWLLVQIHADKAEVFFHSREIMEDAPPTDQQNIYSTAIENIDSVCRKVNQALLLKELNKSKVCNALLVPEADEDINWASKATKSGLTKADGYDIDDDDDSEEGQGYLAAAMDFGPGYFACDVVWQSHFVLPPRLRCVQRPGLPSNGVLALRQVLNNFLVTNRKNMFVIEELSSRNVFYLRLKEIQVAQDSDIEPDSSVSDFNQMSSIRQQNKGDSDSVSLTSSLGRQSSKYEEAVEITVHGIEDVGKEIKDDLMKMLQNKLDDALLDNLTAMFGRNPQSKLKPDDITFIQKPHHPPVDTLLLTIPGHCSMYLVALMYYLKQNLLQFLNVPNYVDLHPTCQFQDLYDGVWAPIPSDKVYLYIRPQPGGGKGLACITVNLVDGQGKQVKLLNCPAPTKNNMPSLSDPSEFDKYVQTTVHEKSASSRPGPTALIQFRIWECGNSDVKVLRERLIAAVRHALCDIVMEYFMLTSPICSVPKNLMDVCAPPVSSLPASPTKLPAESLERKHNPLSRKLSVDPPRSVTHSISMFSSFPEHKHQEIVGKCLDFNTVPATTDQSPLPRTPGAAQAARGKDLPDMRPPVAKYESGEKGNLHPVFCSLIKPWMEFCHSIGVPSVYSSKLKFQAKYSIDFVMKELNQSIPSIASDTSLKIFKVIQTSTPSQPPYGVLFTPCKVTPRDIHMNRVLESLAANGGKVNLIAIGRSMDQWHDTVLEHQDMIPNISSSALKGYRMNQKFQLQMPDTDSKVSEPGNLKSAEKDFVPRQRLIIITCEKKELSLLLYNWSNEQQFSIEKTTKRLIEWNNARSFVLNSILAQKMGLFHHFQFTELQYATTQNPFTQSPGEVESLIRNHTPRDFQRRNSSMSVKEREKSGHRPIKRIIPFDQTYKMIVPPKHLNKITVRLTLDPVSRHGIPTQELRAQSRQDKQQTSASRKDLAEEKVLLVNIKDPVFQHGHQLTEAQRAVFEEEDHSKLYSLYLGFLQMSGKNKANPPIMEDYLMQLKRSCRLFHYCATPLIFSSSWRQSVVQKTTCKTDKSRQDNNPASTYNILNATAGLIAGGTPTTPDRTHKTFPNLLPVPSPVSRSRHSSGTSNISFKGKPNEELSRKGSEARLFHGRSRSDVEEEEAQWHVDLRKRFMKEYKQYLHQLGFIKLKLQPVLKMQGSSMSFQAGSPDKKPMNLQKTLTGGILVMELSFRQEFFCVKMFAIGCSQFKVNVNPQMHLIFVDECDRYKDLIHVHSFAHDFHLRCVQTYLSKEQKVSFLPMDFDLESFLNDFKQIYPYPPSFSRNCLHQDSIILPKLLFPGTMLYEYMLRLKTNESAKFFTTRGKSVLVIHELLELCSQTQSTEDYQPEKYIAGLIMTNATPEGTADAMKLVLKYFTVLTRDQDCYPLQTLEKDFGETKGTVGGSGKVNENTERKESENDQCKPIAVRQHICMRRVHVNYRGYSNMQQLALLQTLFKQSEKGREKILEMVELSTRKCRRDYLWQRLLTSHHVEDSSKKKSADPDDSTDSGAPFSSEEFFELLQSVATISLNEVDSQLTPLFNMPYHWYHGLYTAFVNKYPGSHRCFTSPNNKTQYIVVFNANNLDMFAMLALTDSTEQMELCVVTKEKLVDFKKHLPDYPNLPLYSLQTHVEDLVNVCCYHMWASMLQ